jgi:radical SAM protein (TIGR01212 family)
MNLMNNNKHYNTLDAYYKHKYGKKVAKISLNANLTCPNRDGSKGFGGCSYCSAAKSGDFAGKPTDSIIVQFNKIKSIMNQKWNDSLYIPYFQAGTNTYADIETLEKLYLEAINASDDIVELAIATRCDCINEKIVELLTKINKIKPVQIELGLQTSNDKTKFDMNFGYTNEDFIYAVNLLRKNNIEVVVHIINGLPNETIDDMLNTINFVNSLDIQGIKIHSLLVLKNTKLYNDYLTNPFHLLTLEEYVDITTLQIRKLNPNIIIHRLAADGSLDDLIEPKWTMKKLVVMNEIDKKLRLLNAYQGDKYND